MTESSQNVVFVVYQHSSGKQDSFTLVWPNKVTIYGLIEKFILPKLKMKRIPKCQVKQLLSYNKFSNALNIKVDTYDKLQITMILPTIIISELSKVNSDIQSLMQNIQENESFSESVESASEISFVDQVQDQSQLHQPLVEKEKAEIAEAMNFQLEKKVQRFQLVEEPAVSAQASQQLLKTFTEYMECGWHYSYQSDMMSLEYSSNNQSIEFFERQLDSYLNSLDVHSKLQVHSVICIKTLAQIKIGELGEQLRHVLNSTFQSFEQKLLFLTIVTDQFGALSIIFIKSDSKLFEIILALPILSKIAVQLVYRDKKQQLAEHIRISVLRKLCGFGDYGTFTIQEEKFMQNILILSSEQELYNDGINSNTQTLFLLAIDGFQFCFQSDLNSIVGFRTVLFQLFRQRYPSSPKLVGQITKVLQNRYNSTILFNNLMKSKQQELEQLSQFIRQEFNILNLEHVTKHSEQLNKATDLLLALFRTVFLRNYDYLKTIIAVLTHSLDKLLTNEFTDEIAIEMLLNLFQQFINMPLWNSTEIHSNLLKMQQYLSTLKQFNNSKLNYKVEVQLLLFQKQSEWLITAEANRTNAFSTLFIPFGGNIINLCLLQYESERGQFYISQTTQTKKIVITDSMLLNVDEFVGSPVTKQFLAIVPEIMRQMDKFKLSIFQQSIVDNFLQLITLLDGNLTNFSVYQDVCILNPGSIKTLNHQSCIVIFGILQQQTNNKILASEFSTKMLNYYIQSYDEMTNNINVLPSIDSMYLDKIITYSSQQLLVRQLQSEYRCICFLLVMTHNLELNEDLLLSDTITGLPFSYCSQSLDIQGALQYFQRLINAKEIKDSHVQHKFKIGDEFVLINYFYASGKTCPEGESFKNYYSISVLDARVIQLLTGLTGDCSIISNIIETFDYQIYEQQQIFDNDEEPHEIINELNPDLSEIQWFEDQIQKLLSKPSMSTSKKLLILQPFQHLARMMQCHSFLQIEQNQNQQLSSKVYDNPKRMYLQKQWPLQSVINTPQFMQLQLVKGRLQPSEVEISMYLSKSVPAFVGQINLESSNQVQKLLRDSKASKKKYDQALELSKLFVQDIMSGFDYPLIIPESQPQATYQQYESNLLKQQQRFNTNIRLPIAQSIDEQRLNSEKLNFAAPLVFPPQQIKSLNPHIHGKIISQQIAICANQFIQIVQGLHTVGRGIETMGQVEILLPESQEVFYDPLTEGEYQPTANDLLQQLYRMCQE